ncbi:SGNH hydrolase [Ascodesmis nigricans]|uniref:SGNH hydrolase n=1 Tax=Ascodesmis nigricans TaxID=341454 RepID=A0A4S2MR75_9PEZI|nr:SGNH hydrolase [Ascodesmis nigricans]
MAFCDYDKVLLFGDSITEQSFEQTRGFASGAALSDAYRRKLEVLNRGFSGYNTAHALHVLPQIIPPPTDTCRIRLVILFFGANDAVLPGQLQHVSVSNYRRNLHTILTHPLLLAHNPKFILITPPAMCEYTAEECDRAKGKPITQRQQANTKLYVDAALSVGEELKIPTINLWKAWTESHAMGKEYPGSRELPRNQNFLTLLRDGLHFNPQG